MTQPADNVPLLKPAELVAFDTLGIHTLSMSQPWDYIAKLVCIGDSGTGKSSVSSIMTAELGPC